MVYVDNAGAHGIVNDRTGYWCRLTADSLEELHTTARELGVDFRFFCPDSGYRIKNIGLEIVRPSYLVTLAMAARAVALFGVKSLGKPAYSLTT